MGGGGGWTDWETGMVAFLKIAVSYKVIDKSMT
jgi:hypothetical protein